MSKRTLIVFERPCAEKFTQLYKEEAVNYFEVKYLSDFKESKNCIGLIRKQYEFLKSQGIEENTLNLPYDEIHYRCRFLRQKDKKLAKKLINSLYMAVDEIFSVHHPVAVISFPVDNYILDVIFLYCKLKNIYFISPCDSTLPKKIRLTTRGEKVFYQTQSDEEVEKYFHALSKPGFKPLHSVKHRKVSKLLFLYGKERIKKLVFAYRKFVQKNPYAFHYNCIYPLPGVITVYSIKDLWVSKYFIKHLSVIQSYLDNYEKRVFFPLQVSPETALNYFIDDYRFSDYAGLVKKIIDTLPDNVLLIVKEHPSFYGYRPREFYRQFLEKPNVLLISPNISISQILEWVQTVLVTGSSSTGVESIVKNKTVISFGGAFYKARSCIDINDFDKVADWPNYLEEIYINESEKKAFVKFMLEGCADGDYTLLTKLNRKKANKEMYENARITIRSFLDVLRTKLKEENLII